VDHAARTIGVIMAGGAGERMSRSGEAVPKPMVPVCGVPLVERNLAALLRAGVTRAVVVVGPNAAAAPVRDWARGRGRELGDRCGATVSVLTEPRSLGNAGALALVGTSADDVLLLVFADNLTSLDLGGLVDTHARSGADLTLAVHTEAFRPPYGVVDRVGDRVTGYREKPDLPLLVGTGIAVVGPLAVATMAATEGPHGIADLVRLSLAGGLDVRAVEHSAAWVDVNDAPSRDRAEAMVRADPAAFGGG
jgi:NDP-sugar pyrophosphorylase family protein